ncbi:MAG: rod shape-determining protein RodA [Syntrophorhabdales bacterium]|jgi:rod shape determining protein RodA
MRIDRRRLYHLDWYLILNGLILLAIGFVNLASATRSIDTGLYNLLLKQGMAFCLGVAVLLLVLSYDYRLIASHSRHFYAATLFFIVFVLVIGTIAGGAKRWLTIAGIAFQPSELMKPVMVVMLANMLFQRKKEDEPLNMKDILLPLVYIVVPCILILKQPDLGTAVVILLSCLCILWFVGLTKLTYLFLGIVGLSSIPVLWTFLMKPYQKMRILSLINPDLDPSGYGYHSIQAKIAVGSGGLLGKGYLNGTQHKLHFIPEHHTDFIFTVFGEEWGFIGSIILFLLFVSFIYRCLKISQNTKEPVGSTIAFGIASIIFVQFTINILMAINLAPVVGIPLPFISYGGSSLISTLIGVALLLNVNMRRYMF